MFLASEYSRKKILLSALIVLVSIVLLFPETISAQPKDLILDCASGKEYSCDKDINVLLKQAIRVANYLLGIAGSISLIAFIYGGFTMLTAFGKADRFKEGKKALIAATAGLAISFSAYLIVGFVLDAMGVQGQIRAIQSL